MFNFMYIVYFVQHRFHCPSVYIALDRTNAAITALETEMATLAEQASLFDVNVPDFKQIKMCRKDVKMLKV
jgi:dynein heavy chain